MENIKQYINYFKKAVKNVKRFMFPEEKSALFKKIVEFFRHEKLKRNPIRLLMRSSSLKLICVQGENQLMITLFPSFGANIAS
jgi:hypothetical protein